MDIKLSMHRTKSRTKAQPVSHLIYSSSFSTAHSVGIVHWSSKGHKSLLKLDPIAWGGGCECSLRMLSPSLSLSLSHTHTHTHTYAHILISSLSPIIRPSEMRTRRDSDNSLNPDYISSGDLAGLYKDHPGHQL